MFDDGFFLTLASIRRQLAAMPNDFYFIPWIDPSTHRVCPGERLWTAQQLKRRPVIRARNREGFDVYLRPYADGNNAGYILLDLDHGPPAILLLEKTTARSSDTAVHRATS